MVLFDQYGWIIPLVLFVGIWALLSWIFGWILWGLYRWARKQ